MEFVQNTTTSTPFTSRSSSAMNFGDYREDELPSFLSSIQVEDDFIPCDPDSDDDEDKILLDGFNVMTARNRLTSYEHCTQISLDLDQQKGLELEIGVNVSYENPWKIVGKQLLLDHLRVDETSKQEIKDFSAKLCELDDDDFVLVGYALPLSADINDSDAFLFYVDPESSKESLNLIQKLEAFERQNINRTIYKYPRPWKSLGSEKEVDLQVETKHRPRIEVEIQRLCPLKESATKLSFRLAEDVRDGYVELISKDNSFDLIYLKSVSVGIQSAAERVESEQQTDPKFPENSWTQYLYEIKPDSNFKQETKDDESVSKHTAEGSDEENKAKAGTEFLPQSESIKQLLLALEMNAIDVYKDDYAALETEEIRKFEMPEIKEVSCFIDAKIMKERYVNGFAWHPSLSGVFVASYTYNTMNLLLHDQKVTAEEIGIKLVNETNPVLLWSFDDFLYPKLRLEATREVTFLSFCPYDADILIGGLRTGQLVIWDLKDRLANIENADTMSIEQEEICDRFDLLMNWSKFKENLRENVVEPVAITPYELSHTKAVTGIKWLNRKHCIATSGLIQEAKPDELFRQFVSTSLDGSISFWDLDFINPTEPKRGDAKRRSTDRQMPTEYISPYAKLNEVIRPVYTISCERPITSFIFDEGRFSFVPKEKSEISHYEERMAFDVIHEVQDKATNRFVISSLMGTINTFIWEGFLCKEGKPESIKQIETFSEIHNGPVLMIERNPFICDVVLSIGHNIFALWSENQQNKPIIWRRREAKLTCAQWSSTKPSLFFIARYDGMIELWDMATRTDCPVIPYDGGAMVITVITQHKLPLSTDVFLIGDVKSNLRLFTIPPAISKPKEGDLKRFKAFINEELSRTADFEEWHQKYNEKNGDLKEAKQLLREESRRTLESDKDSKHQTCVDAKFKTTSKPVKLKPIYDLPERLRQRWEDMNVKRLMKTLMKLKQFDPETISMHIKPEKDRLAYNKLKQHAMEENFCNIQHEICSIRARLVPEQDADEEAERLEFIQQNVDNMALAKMNGFQYDQIENDLNDKTDATKTDVISINWLSLLSRARKQRAESDKQIYEERRKAFLANNNPKPSHDMNELS